MLPDEEKEHEGHDILNKIDKAMLKLPSQLFTPLDNNKTYAVITPIIISRDHKNKCTLYIHTILRFLWEFKRKPSLLSFPAIFVFKEDCGVCVRSVEESEQNSCNLFRSSKVRICGILMGARKKTSCAIILSHVIVHSCSCFLFFF